MLTTAPVALLAFALFEPSASSDPFEDSTVAATTDAPIVEPPIVEPVVEPAPELPPAAVVTEPAVVTPDPQPRRASEPSVDPRNAAVEAFTARRGFRMATAGTAIAAAGVAWTGIAGWMLSNDDPRLNVSLAFVVDGAIATTVGLGLPISGARRSRDPGKWLAKRASRRDRMTAAAGHFEPHAATTQAERNVVERGTKLRNYGFLTLSSGMGLLAFGTGMQFAYGGDNLALKIVVPTVSAPFIIAGAALLAAGGRRVYSPHRYVGRGEATASQRARVQLAAAPSFQRGGMGISLSGRF